jgi:von Willebrand factor type A domain
MLCFFFIMAACSASIADIVFVLDGSGSIGASNFANVRLFVQNVVGYFDVNQQKVRIGLIEFSNSATTEFSLTTYNTTAAVQTAVMQIPYFTGGKRKLAYCYNRLSLSFSKMAIIAALLVQAMKSFHYSILMDLYSSTSHEVMGKRELFLASFELKRSSPEVLRNFYDSLASICERLGVMFAVFRFQERFLFHWLRSNFTLLSWIGPGQLKDHAKSVSN